jgi:stage II sporulation protein M
MMKLFSFLIEKLRPDSQSLITLCVLIEGLILGYLLGSRTSLSGGAEALLLSVLCLLAFSSFLGYMATRADGMEVLARVKRAARFNIKTYLWNTRYYFLIVAFTFALAVSIGVVASVLSPEYFESGYSFTKSSVGNVADRSNPLSMSLGIFSNNARVAATMGVMGSLCAGLTAFWGNTLNGTVFGIVLYKTLSYYGVAHGLYVFVVSIFPHGIIELPAIFLSGALALRVAWGMLQAKAHKMKYGLYRLLDNVVKVVVVYLVVILPSLFVAAFIESYVTIYLIRLLLG